MFKIVTPSLGANRIKRINMVDFKIFNINAMTLKLGMGKMENIDPCPLVLIQLKLLRGLVLKSSIIWLWNISL